ncbi:MAG: hypothetical protein IT317_08205 [Anaerolineales bacterium]|nr:hypothetical protein [Anaerolineales bacterium]
MGKKMAKTSVIWGDKHAVTLAQFGSAHMQAIQKEVRLHVGAKVPFPTATANQVINTAKTNPKMKNAYVKVGLVDGALVMRVKEKKFLGDVEADAVLVTNFKAKSEAFRQEMLQQLTLEAETAKKELQKLKDEAERKKRLEEVMSRKDSEGTSLRDRLLRAAQTAQKLGIGNYAQTKLKVQGLTAMDPQYHGEVLDRKQNRYGRYLPQLKKVWDDKVAGKLSFSSWLDAVEKGDLSVAGVKEALEVTNPEVGQVVKPGGIAGGLMVYLDDEARKGYVATASKGALTGPTVKNGALIFVIGSDNKLYVGSKARANPGVRGAFNHSSFFSGGPVKSAGTLLVAGGKVTQIDDQSGHYAPTRAMTVAAVRKIGGGDSDWLSTVDVKVGGKATKGNVFLDGARNDEAVEIWSKHSLGAVSRAQAEAYLKASPDGSWLIREGSGKELVYSVRTGEKFGHDYVRNIGGAGLDLKKRLNKNKLPDVKPEPSAPPSKPKVSKPQGSEQREKESEEQPTLNPRHDQALRRSPAWHGDINRVTAEGLLKDKPGFWLLRLGRDGFVALSMNNNGKLEHALVNSDEAYVKVERLMRANPGGALKP